MELSLVVAIIRRDALEAAEKRLHEIGVRGITVISAKGFGDRSLPHDILGRPLMREQVKLEIYVTADRAERVAACAIDAAHATGVPDGIVAILPVQRILSVSTRSDTVPNRPSA
jgi:nitrogen regulatory protein PII